MKTDTRDYEALKADAGAFRQQVRMAAVQVAGLSSDELKMALAFEVEPFSGIPAAEADVIVLPVPVTDAAVRIYDVTVKRRRDTSSAGRWARLVVPAIVLGALIVLGAAGDATYLALRQRRLDREVAVRRTLDAQVKSVRAQAATARRTAEDLRATRAAAVRAQDDAAAMRAAFPEILSELAAACGERAVVKTLGGDVLKLSVGGVATGPQAAADVMVDLTARAAEKGWRLVPGPIATSADGITASFGFTLTRDLSRD